MRKAAIAAAALLSTLVLTIYLWRIEPLLPERGGTTCFAANYDPPRPIDLSSPRRDERSVGNVSSMRLEIHFPPDEKRKDHEREYHNIPNREEGKDIRNLGLRDFCFC